MIEFTSALPLWLRTVLYGGSLVLLLWWLCWRSGSPHVIVARLWTLAQGKPQAGDPKIRHFLARRSSLMQFRAVTGLRCRTLTQAHRLLAWADDHNEEVGDIARCGPHFDLELPGLKPVQPSRLRIAGAVAFLAICAVSLTLTGAAALSPRAWVSVKNGSGRQLLLSVDSVKVWRTGRYFGKGDCAAIDHERIAVQAGLPVGDVATVCKWLDDPSIRSNVEHVLDQQRLALGLLGLMLAAYGLLAYRWFIGVTAALSMRRRLVQRQSLPAQPGLGQG